MANPVPGAAPAAPIPVANQAAPKTPAPNQNPNPVAAPEAVKPPEATFEVVIDGQKQVLTEAQVKKLASKSGYADRTVRQAKEALKRIKEAETERHAQLEAARGNPGELLRLHGIDPDEFARAVLTQKIEEGKLSPEQRRIAELEAAQAESQRKLEEHQAKQDSEQQQVLVGQLQQQMENELFQAAERAGMPRDADSFYAIYAAVQEAHDLGLPWDPDRIMEVAQASIDTGFQRLETATLKSLKGEALLKRLGSAVVEEVLKARVEQIRGKKAFGTKQAANDNTERARVPTKPSEYISPTEAEARMRKLASGK